jgi:hypothetical protein
MAAPAVALTLALPFTHTPQSQSLKEDYDMATSKNKTAEMEAATIYKAINRAIHAVDVAEMETEQAAIADTPGNRMQKLANMYAAVKPLLATLTTLPLIPASWRAALALFTSALEAVVLSPESSPSFKAGKDL